MGQDFLGIKTGRGASSSGFDYYSTQAARLRGNVFLIRFAKDTTKFGVPIPGIH